MNLEEILFGTWLPPENFTTRSHRILGTSSRKKPVIGDCKKKILKALSSSVWKTNKDISDETGLLINLVHRHTTKLFKDGKIERSSRKEASDIKPVFLFRMLNGDLGGRHDESSSDTGSDTGDVESE